MTANLAYRSFAIERVRKFRGTLGQTISWFLDRDRETQKVALSLYAEGYPWGEAMQQTYENRTAVLWQIGPVGVVDDSLSAPPALPDKPAAKKRKDDTLPDTQKRPRPDRSTGQQVDTSTGKSIQLKDLCPDWNRGQCTRRQADCKHGKLHRCSHPCESGFCGVWQHTAAQHKAKKSG